MKWFLSFLIACVAFIMVGIATIGTAAQGVHTDIAVGMLATIMFSILMWCAKAILDEL